MLFEPKRKVFWFAVSTRVAILILQCIFNALCPDHSADAFKGPLDANDTVSSYDNVITFLFGGLTRWDAEYFIHIAKYGYTYENTLAFYPLFPITVSILATLLKSFLFMLNTHSTIIIAAALLNLICFVKSAGVFYDLSRQVLHSTSTAYKAAILYCVNPASIFFSAAYSESMFAYLTLYGMWASIKNDPYIPLPIGLSTLVRSNGAINIGFPLYYWMKNLFNEPLTQLNSEHNDRKIRRLWQIILQLLSFRQWFVLLNIISLSLAPLLLLQVFNYVTYCVPSSMKAPLPVHVVQHAIQYNLVLSNSSSITWCNATVPIAYSYIQKKYWNVGFMSYYEFKQLPNFILALPVLCIMLTCITEFCMEHRQDLLSLGLFTTTQNRQVVQRKYPSDMLVFVIHGAFLTLFSIFFVHIQVSTRLLASASPLMYWYCALHMSYKPCKRKHDPTFEEEINLSSKWKVYFLSQTQYTLMDKLILSYFLGYFVLGIILFSNFLPWT